MSLEQCLRESRINRRLICPPLQNPNESLLRQNTPSKLLSCPNYLRPRYLFAYQTSNQDAKTNALVIKNIMTKHACSPTTLIFDKGPAFIFHVTKEVAAVLGITLNHATTNYAQTVVLLERSHSSIEQTSKIETGERYHCGISTSALRSLVTAHHITRVLPVDRAELFMYAFLIMSLI